MIHIKPIQPDVPEWHDWCARAADAEANTSADTKIDEKLYKEQRALILKMFNKKCAYCEVRLDESQRFGDIDHYRPKGSVTDREGKPVLVNGKKHPGYFWLAYRWNNLLPSCINCNRPGTGPDGTKSGKWDKFPISGRYALTDADLSGENPLLLNPYEDDPNEHLDFNIQTGVVGGITLRGIETIEILGLNREGLIDARIRTVMSIRSFWGDYVQAISRLEFERADMYEPMIREYASGEAPFSAIARKIMRLGGSALEARLARRI